MQEHFFQHDPTDIVPHGSGQSSRFETNTLYSFSQCVIISCVPVSARHSQSHSQSQVFVVVMCSLQLKRGGCLRGEVISPSQSLLVTLRHEWDHAITRAESNSNSNSPATNSTALRTQVAWKMQILYESLARSASAGSSRVDMSDCTLAAAAEIPNELVGTRTTPTPTIVADTRVEDAEASEEQKSK